MSDCVCMCEERLTVVDEEKSRKVGTFKGRKGVGVGVGVHCIIIRCTLERRLMTSAFMPLAAFVQAV